jgi:hypothetical protein
MEYPKTRVRHEKVFLRRYGPQILVRLDRFWHEECATNYLPGSAAWQAHLRLVEDIHNLAGAITGDSQFLSHQAEWSAKWRDRFVPCAEFSRAWWLREMEVVRERELAAAC